MAVLERDKFFEAVHARIGEDTTDEAIQFIEDMTDTYNDLETKATGDGVDWQERYKELDEKWKKKYSHRFFSGGAAPRPVIREEDETETIDEEESREKITYKDLFTDK